MSVSQSPPQVIVVGIGADGWDGLGREARACVEGAGRIIGSERQLALLPPIPNQTRVSWPSPFSIEVALSESPAVVLASGDPLLSGVATTLIERLGPAQVRVIPHLSSITLARARLGWSAESSVVVSLVGRHEERILRELAPGRRILALTSGASTPATVAALLVEAGFGDSVLSILGDLGSADESRRTTTAAAFEGEAPALHVLAIEVVGDAGVGWATGLPDDVFEHDGQLTKRDLRASALARLMPLPGQTLWDVGAGAGSVAIEWMRAHPTCSAYAVERSAERADRIARNAARLGVPDLAVVEGSAPGALDDLPEPDAIFVGGGATVPGVIDTCLERLQPGGRLVVHGVTLETEHILGALHDRHGGELTRLQVEIAQPLGAFTGWTPARAVVQWAYRSVSW